MQRYEIPPSWNPGTIQAKTNTQRQHREQKTGGSVWVSVGGRAKLEYEIVREDKMHS